MVDKVKTKKVETTITTTFNISVDEFEVILLNHFKLKASNSSVEFDTSSYGDLRGCTVYSKTYEVEESHV